MCRETSRREEQSERARIYRTILGFQEVPKPVNLHGRGGVRFDTGTLQHHLGAERAFRAAGNAHVAFEVDGRRDRLVASGCALADDEPLAGYRRCCVADRCGNRMGLLEAE